MKVDEIIARLEKNKKVLEDILKEKARLLKELSEYIKKEADKRIKKETGCNDVRYGVWTDNEDPTWMMIAITLKSKELYADLNKRMDATYKILQIISELGLAEIMDYILVDVIK